MRLTFVLMLLVATALSYTPKQLQQMYREKKAEYNMDFPRTHHDEEEHFHEFCTFANMVEKHNTENGEEWLGEVNTFSMMTPVERDSYLGLNVSTVLEEQSRSLFRRSAAKFTLLEERADSADYSKKLPPVKNQGGCGSCWTFGATAALEYQINKNSGDIKALSEQQYLDCVYEGVRDGCNGGWPTKCYGWTMDNNNMIASMADYPYTGRDGSCRTDVKSAISGFKVESSRYVSKGDDNMLAAVSNAEIGVLSVAIGVVNSFFSFKSGVYSESGCNSINHAVDVVGYGTLSGVDYWRVRNSWGASWGDRGYINMKRGPNTCAISDYAHYPVVSGSSDEGSDDKEDDEEGEEEEDDEEEDEEEEEKTCRWRTVENKKLKQNISDLEYTKEEAMMECKKDEKCAGISCKSARKCMLNGSKKGKSSEKFTGYIKICV